MNKHIEEEFPDKGDELQKAEKLLQDCLDEQPGNAIAHYFLGKLYNDLNLLHKAEFHLEKALKADSKDYEFIMKAAGSMRSWSNLKKQRNSQGSPFNCNLNSYWATIK
ncbi:hypothetical protein CVD25_03375 [Bacillus canaveralius]|uniref:Uncharacterized protein n=1 Tax=Bacillus canaveralius TaxID=1403243 RepID=A0A2N5GSA4_9BACI|nr:MULTISPECIES: tetratricopeptide repeat protein [Bacillus]PLR86523.1 hypothetical protein CU635_00970 [Bacillus canaveralius]PLR87848.1 hypothetical protein CVD23_01350 [Bacillus sp. V33-4]PLS00294.1 hypothetical protein CVD25_03375 [Bacillus canaveralius]RSK55297.1 hypothetical protein EJA13_04550 [Bacillus canaveralius]